MYIRCLLSVVDLIDLEVSILACVYARYFSFGLHTQLPDVELFHPHNKTRS